MKFREKLLLAKIESVEGVAENLTGANAILAKDFDINPLEAEAIQRGLDKPYLGADEVIHSGEHVSISLKVEFQGSGTAGTAPAYAPLLRMCGLSEIITANTSVEYVLAADNHETGTLNFFMGKNLHAMRGTKGDVEVVFEKGIVYLSFNFIGLWVAPDQQNPPTPDFSKFQKPTPTGKGRTSGFSILGFAGEPYTLSVKLGQDVQYIESLVGEEIQINNREGSGSTSIKAPEIDTQNFFAAALNSDTGALSIQQGQTAGKICKLDCPKVQVMNPKYSDNQGTTALDLDIALIPSDAGNDEFKLTFL